MSSLITTSVTADTWLNKNGTENYKCRAWAVINGSGASITSGGNVSSLIDNGTGDYTINFTTAMPSVNYVPVMQWPGRRADQAFMKVASNTEGSNPLTKTTTGLRIWYGATIDVTVYLAIFGG